MRKNLSGAAAVAALCIASVLSADDGGLIDLQGVAVQGGLIMGRAPAGASVELDGEPLRHAADGYFLVGFGRDDTAPRKLVVRGPDGSREVRELKPEPRQFDIQRIDGLPPSQVTPDAESLERIRREAGQVRKARERLDTRIDFADGFVWPVHGPVTGVYGSQRILNGEPRSPHWGVDLAAPTGTPGIAPAAGVVTLAHADMYFPGGARVTTPA